MASTAGAETIQSFLTGVVDNGNGTFTYNYQLKLTNDNGLTSSGSFESGLVILDFVGLTGAQVLSSVGTDVTATTDWSISTPATGGGTLANSSYSAITGKTTLTGDPLAPEVSGFDSAAYANVVLEYIGGGLPVSGTVRNLINLSLTSIYGVHTPNAVLTLSRDTKSDGAFPVETFAIDAPVVPLPAAAWAGMALMGFISANKLRVSRRLQA